jgi:5-methylcytosine-specific restriction endonuclease McrA
LNQDNLMLLCTDCHNKEHHRFGRLAEYDFDSEGNLVSRKSK